MNTNTENTTTTPTLSGIDFGRVASEGLRMTPPEPATPADTKPPGEVVSPAKGDDKGAPVTPEAGVEKGDATTTPSANAPDKGLDDDKNNADNNFYAEEELEDVSNGLFGMSISEVEQKLQRLEELEKQGSTFKSEKHKKAYEFISQYNGDDFQEGIVRYARLSNADLSKMDAKTILKEHFIQSTPELSATDAAELFEAQYQEKYAAGLEDPDREKITKILLEKDKATAIKALNEMKESFKSQDADVNAEADKANQKYEEYLSQLEKEVTPFEEYTFSIPEVEGSDFSFKIEDFNEVKESLKSEAALYESLGWFDGQKLDLRQMASDVAFLRNKEAFAEELFKHGRTFEREAMMKEINNTKGAAKTQETGTGGAPQTFQEALKAGIQRMPERR